MSDNLKAGGKISIKDEEDNNIIFAGQIFSNKVPLIYEVYNDK